MPLNCFNHSIALLILRPQVFRQAQLAGDGPLSTRVLVQTKGMGASPPATPFESSNKSCWRLINSSTEWGTSKAEDWSRRATEKLNWCYSKLRGGQNIGTDSNDKLWRWQRIIYEIAFEVCIVVLFLKAYNGVRNKFGSQKCTPEFALGHAMQVIHAERALGIFWEQEIQGAVLDWRWWIKFWNIFYGTAHMAVTIFVLIYLFAFKAGAYQRCRSVFIIMNVLAISGYAGYPLMPPRLVNACDDPYGGCAKQYHFVDTLHEIGGLWSWKDKGVSKVSNHYAAMPSMHAGYSIWCAVSAYKYSGNVVIRSLAIMYPFMTLYCIVVTANHYFMDAVFGCLAFFIASKLAVYLPRVGRGADERDCDHPEERDSQLDKLGNPGWKDELGLLLPITMPRTDSCSTDSNSPSRVNSVHITVTSLQKR